MKLERIITHKNMRKYLDALLREPCYQMGSTSPVSPDDWHQQIVVLELPTGELAEDGLKNMAILGRQQPGDLEYSDLTGKEGFRAQGLEGMVRVRKTLFGALMNLRDLIAEHRGRIVTR